MKTYSDIAIIVPTYIPEEGFLPFIEELSQYDFHSIIIVNDGSGDIYDDSFEKAAKFDKVTVCRHAINMGKGRAMKTGINYYLDNCEGAKGVVFVDADGQHLPKDILMIAEKLQEKDDTLIMGSRKFDKNVPWTSQTGNAITRNVYAAISGIRVFDTQTGLRGIPNAFLGDIMKMKGEKYDFEMEMLMNLKSINLKIEEYTIETVYINNNSASHFNKFKDAVRIYYRILSHLSPSFNAVLLDFAVFVIAYFLLTQQNLILSVLFARLISFGVDNIVGLESLVNKSEPKKVLRRRNILQLFLLLFQLGATLGLNILGLNIIAAKIIADVVFYIVHAILQKRLIYK